MAKIRNSNPKTSSGGYERLLGNKDIGYDPSPLYHRVYYSQTLTINRAPTAWPVPYSYRSHL